MGGHHNPQLEEDEMIVDMELMPNGVGGGLMMLNQRSGSYSNLYPEGELSQVVSGEGHYSNLPPHRSQSHLYVHQMNNNDNNNESVGSGLAGGGEDHPAVLAQHHVYSNINGDDDGPPPAATGMLSNHSRSSQMVADAVVGGANEKGSSWRDTSSVDDMDLDDLSAVATAFQGQATPKKSQQVKRTKNEKISSDSSVSSSSSRPLYDAADAVTTSTPVVKKSSAGKQSKKKHIFPTVAVIETTTSKAANNSSRGGATSDLNEKKWQELHDTTMIDCALDLDSLDTMVVSSSAQKKK